MVGLMVNSKRAHTKGHLPGLLLPVPLSPQRATANPRLHWRLLDIYWQVWVNLLWGHCSFLLDLGAQGFVCALQESVSPVLCKFWLLYGGVNGNLLQVGLCHTQAHCTQSPWPCSSPRLTHTSTGDTQTLNGRSGPVSCGGHCSFPRVLLCIRFCLCPPRVESVSPSSVEVLQSNPVGLHSQNPWGFLVPLLDPQARTLRTITRVRELLWY